MSTSTLPQQSTCPSWCTDHDDDTDGTTLAHQQHVATASGFDVRVNELLEVTDPSLEISGAHVRIIAPETEDNYLTSEAARELALALFAAAGIAETSRISEPSAGCPSWCRHHMADDGSFASPVHQATVTVGDADLTIEAYDAHIHQPVGAYIDALDWQWINGPTIRNYAAALAAAADLIGVPAAGTPASHVA